MMAVRMEWKKAFQTLTLIVQHWLHSGQLHSSALWYPTAMTWLSCIQSEEGCQLLPWRCQNKVAVVMLLKTRIKNLDSLHILRTGFVHHTQWQVGPSQGTAHKLQPLSCYGSTSSLQAGILTLVPSGSLSSCPLPPLVVLPSALLPITVDNMNSSITPPLIVCSADTISTSYSRHIHLK